MPAPDPVAAMIAEYNAMPPHRRRRILRALGPEERARLEATDEPATAMSDWLEQRLAIARSGRASASPAMTEATLAVLRNAAHRAGNAAPEPPRGRSLAEGIGGLLARRGGRNP